MLNSEASFNMMIETERIDNKKLAKLTLMTTIKVELFTILWQMIGSIITSGLREQCVVIPSYLMLSISYKMFRPKILF